MYLMPVGGRTVLVGDPKLAERVLGGVPEEAEAVASFLPGGPDFSEASVASFEAVADHCRQAGYRVVRRSIVPGHDGRTYLTYVNGIIDKHATAAHRLHAGIQFRPITEPGGGRGVGRPGLRGAARRVRRLHRCFGTLHCLVNVLRRD